jgi:hypothetical protein
MAQALAEQTLREPKITNRRERTMKQVIPSIGRLVTGSALVLSLGSPIQAQRLPTDLVQIAASDIPSSVCDYRSIQNFWWPPLPCDWLSASNPVLYVSPSLGTNIIWVGDQDIDYAQQAAEAEVLRLAARAADDGPPLPPGVSGGGTGGDSGGGWSGGPWTYGTNDFWLEALSVAGNPVSAGSSPGSMASNLFNVILHGTTNGSNYLITSTEAMNPLTNSTWLVEGSLQGGTNDATPFALGIATRTNSLFLRAQPCDECATTALPLGWQLAYFGVTGVDPNADYDGDGVNNLAEYLNGTDPNKISFSLSVTSQYVNATAVPVQLNLAGGVPSHIALLVNDTNPADANWQPFTTTNLSVPTPADGTYVVTVGLCGLPPNAAQTWQSLTLFRDTTPLTLVLTNPVVWSGSRPFIDPAGYTTRALSALTWAVVDANGGSGAVVAQSWNLPDPYHTTNWFQCVDLALALGTNWISIQATDWAGMVAVTNFAYVFDTNGDITPPALALAWPQDGTQVSGDSLTVQAWTDDDTAAVALQYTDTNGILETVNGLVERGGNVWVENVPVTAGTNRFSLVATDAAGNVNTTNFSVVQSSVTLTVYPLSQTQMQYASAMVAGTVGDPECTISVNRVQGTNYGNGAWEVANVPLPPGGTVTLQVTAQLSGGGALQTLSEQMRAPIVFTQTYAYNLDYTFFSWTVQSNNVQTNSVWTGHSEFDWARGAGGANLVLLSGVDLQTGGVVSNRWVTAWPADNGYLPSLPGQAVFNEYSNGVWVCGYTSAVDPPSVEWMEQSASGGTLPEECGASWGEASSRQVRLFTGGKGLRQSQGLFDLSAALTVESVVDADVTDWNVFHTGGGLMLPGLPPVAVPPQQISLGALGTLGSDGNLWTLQPNDLETIITPEAPVTSFEGQPPPGPPLPTAQKYRLYILANGTPLAEDYVAPQAKYCVGQYLGFSPMWRPVVPPGISNQAVQWNFDGNYVNDSWQLCTNNPAFPVPIYYGSVNYTNNPAMLTNQNTHAWWVSGGFESPDEYTASLTNKLSFSNGQTVTLSRTGLFDMSRPKIFRLVPWTNTCVVLNTNNPSLIYLGVGGKEVWESGAMRWELYFKVPQAEVFLGNVAYTQLVQGDFDYNVSYLGVTIWLSESTDGEYWLDNREEYLTKPVINSSTTMQWFHFMDGPSLSAPFLSFADEMDLFKTYVRYKPGTAGSIYITLGRIDWGWHGQAEGTPWSLTISNIFSPVLDTSDQAFPCYATTYYNAGSLH